MDNQTELLESPTKTEDPLRREIGVNELGNLLSAFGNHEAKGLTLALMEPGIIYDRPRLGNRLIAAQGANPGWRISQNGAFGYCGQSLQPIGLVAREIVNHDLSTYGFEISPYGLEVGLALDGHLLDWSLRTDISLSQVFGSTISSSKITGETEGEEADSRKRAPATRLKIFWELLTSSSLPMRETDLAAQVGESEGILQSHLENLARAGIIEYRAIGMDNPYAFYKLSEKKLTEKLHISEPTLANRIYSLFASAPDAEFSPEDICNKLMAEYPEYKDTSKEDMMLIRIRGILPELEASGYLQNEGFRRDVKSEINLSEEQKIMLYELVGIVERFRSGDREFWKEGVDKAKSIINNPHQVSRLMKKIKESSPAANKVPSADLENWLVTLLIEHPDSTARQLQQYLEDVYGRKTSSKRISQILISSRRFMAEKSHHANSWRTTAD